MADGGHWYDWDGGKRHTIVMKDGRTRDTNLRDARKFNWVPSFSGAFGIMAAPALENWKRKQLLLAAASISRDPFEGDQAWMNEVIRIYEENTTKSRNIGSAIHAQIERALTLKPVTEYQEYVKGACDALRDWCGMDGIVSEMSFAHPLGYGGQCDAHKYGFLADFKSTDKLTEAELPEVWPNHFAQLAAYREGLNMPDARCAIIYVSTTVPGLTHTVEIPEDDLEHGWNLFVRCLSLWQTKNKYWPVPVKEKELI